MEIKDIIIQHLIENEKKNIDVKALAHILLMFSKKGDHNTIIGELLELSVKYFSMKEEKEMNQDLEVDDDEYEKLEGYEWKGIKNANTGFEEEDGYEEEKREKKPKQKKHKE